MGDGLGRDRQAPPRWAVLGAVLGAMLAAGRAAAQDMPGPVDGLMENLHLKARVAPAPDFVTQSRPHQPADFIPVGTPHPARVQPVMSTAEVAAMQADLDAARERQQRRAGRVPAVVPRKPAAPPARGKNTVP